MCGSPQQPQDIRGRRPRLPHNRRTGEITPIPTVLWYWEGRGAPHGSVMGWGVIPSWFGVSPAPYLYSTLCPQGPYGAGMLPPRRWVPQPQGILFGRGCLWPHHSDPSVGDVKPLSASGVGACVWHVWSTSGGWERAFRPGSVFPSL